MTARVRRAGVAAFIVYAVVAAATALLAGRATRPLFDGFAPPPPYRWVNPPPEFAAGNQAPDRAERTVPLGGQGSDATNASTSDTQVILTLPPGAIAAHPPDTSVQLKLVPLDPGTLPAPLPAGLKAAGNAYQVTLVDQPSGTPVVSLATPASAPPTIALTAAITGDTLLFSTDGRQWQTVPSRPFGSTHGLTATFTQPGYFLVAYDATKATTTTAPSSGTGGGSGGFVAALVASVVVAGACAVGFAAYRRRKEKQRQKKRSARRR